MKNIIRHGGNLKVTKTSDCQAPADRTDTVIIEGMERSVSDGYHTFDELYEHRHLLFLNLIECHVTAWKSKLHDDGTTFDGWFIAGIELPTGMITYHLPMRLWDVANVKELDKAPKWDGHTPQDVCERLLKQITR